MSLNKTCSCGAQFTIEDEDLAFYVKVSPRFGGKVYDIPPPTLCPDCRQQRRLAFRNERRLYKCTCGLCGKNTLAPFDPKGSFTIYCSDCWWSDKCDASDYGRNFDFSRPFFEQFDELRKAMPQMALININNENCDYCNLVGDSKNCYLVFGSVHCENCMYGSPYFSRDCVDSLILHKSELCYECVESEKLYNCCYCQNCINSHNLTLCYDMVGCSDCFCCAGLRQKKHHIFNQPVSKEEYEKFIAMANPRSPKVQAKFKTIKQSIPHRFMIGLSNENVFGDNIWNSKNIHKCFSLRECEDCRYINQITYGKDVMDADFGERIEFAYESSSAYEISRVLFCALTWNNVFDLFYSECCTRGANNSFGCVGLKGKKYCILNKQYTREEYEALVPKIIEHMQKTGEWGEFFPMTISPFAYNETVAQEYYPLSQKEAEARGLRWQEEPPPPQAKKTIPANKLPDTIDKIPDDVLNWAILCEKTQRPFIIQKMELEFYRKMGLPVPHLHPDERHKERMALRNPRRLWDRNCAECNKPIKTSYAPDRPEKVLCEECYLKEVG